MSNSQIIILAAGKGARMHSELPKVLHIVKNQTMLERVINTALSITDDIVLVASGSLLAYINTEGYNSLHKLINELHVKQVIQTEQKGTGHAVFTALSEVDNNKNTIILYADNPLLTPSIIKDLENKLIDSEASLVNLTFETPIPGAYGRIVTDENKKFVKIVEFKEANEQEKAITLCNSGVVAFAKGILTKYLNSEWIASKQQAGKEIYLTDMVELLRENGEHVDYLVTYNPELAIGVNTQQELIAANSYFDNHI